MRRPIAGLWATMLIVVGCAEPAPEPGGSSGAAASAWTAQSTLEIWSSMPRQGAGRRITDSVSNAIRLAVEERGSRVGPYAIAYRDMDDSTAETGGWTEAQEISIATSAATKSGVVAYIGPLNSGAAKLSIPILCAAGLAMISPAATYPGLTKPGKGAAGEPERYYPGCRRNFHRVVPADDLQGLAAARWAAQLGFRRAFVVDDGQLYGKGIADVFEREAPGAGLELVGRAGILGTEARYQALAERIRTSDADLLFFGGINEQNAGQLWRDVDDAAPDIGMMGPDGILGPAFIASAGAAAEGTYVTFGGLPPDHLTGRGEAFVRAYRERFDLEPEAYAAYGYEAAGVALAAIEAASSAAAQEPSAIRAKVLDAISATRDYDGVLGTWGFDANGDTTLTRMTGQRVVNEKFEFVAVID